LKHNKEEPVIIGPGGIFYITDHHHLARALSDDGVSMTYCHIVDNISDAKDFWKQLKDSNEVYLKDQKRQRHNASRPSHLCEGPERRSIPQPSWSGSRILRVREE